jgi:uncharacterized protein YdhG (YjbR/CyaY superfamily)
MKQANPAAKIPSRKRDPLANNEADPVAGKSADGVEAVNAYLANVPEPARSTLEKIRATIRSAVPAEATEGLSYGMPAFRYRGALVAYAAFKNHCSFFPMQASLIDEMKEELKGYRTAKGTLQFSLDKPLPAALVKKLVKARVAENEARKTRS